MTVERARYPEYSIKQWEYPFPWRTHISLERWWHATATRQQRRVDGAVSFYFHIFMRSSQTLFSAVAPIPDT